MSINKTDIENFQRALATIHSTPDASLVIEPHRVELTISGEYAWVAHGYQEVTRALDRMGSIIPFSYRGATGRIFQEGENWGGEFTFKLIQIRLKAEFTDPDTVEQELEFIVNLLDLDLGRGEA